MSTHEPTERDRQIAREAAEKAVGEIWEADHDLAERGGTPIEQQRENAIGWALEPILAAITEAKRENEEVRRWQDEYERAIVGWENTKALCDDLREQIDAARGVQPAAKEAMGNNDTCAESYEGFGLPDGQLPFRREYIDDEIGLQPAAQQGAPATEQLVAEANERVDQMLHDAPVRLPSVTAVKYLKAAFARELVAMVRSHTPSPAQEKPVAASVEEALQPFRNFALHDFDDDEQVLLQFGHIRELLAALASASSPAVEKAQPASGRTA